MDSHPADWRKCQPGEEGEEEATGGIAKQSNTNCASATESQTRRSCQGRPGLSQPQGMGWDGRKHNRPDKISLLPPAAEATPAFSLIKNIFKTRTEHLQREVQPRGQATKPASNSTPERRENSSSCSPTQEDKVRLGFNFWK